MTELFADITLGAVIVIGLVMIGGVVFVANMNDPRNAMHPGGRKGRMLDELLIVGVMAPGLCMILLGLVVPTLRENDWWFAVFFGVCTVGYATYFTPPVRRARARVEALRKKAFS